MPKKISDLLQWHATLNKPGREGVAQYMGT